MAWQARLARSVAVSLKDNFSAYGYSTMITGCYALLHSLQQNPGILDIFAGAAGAVSAFVAAEVAMLTIFRDLGGGESERTRIIARMMNFVAVGSGMGGAALCGLYLGGPLAWFLGGFTASLLFILVDGLELAVFHKDGDS